MLNQGGITKESATTRNTILIAPEMAVSFSCKVANTGIEADADGKKIIKAGTPLYGNLTARDTAFTVSASGTSATAVATVPTGQTGITKATVNAATFGAAVGGIGDRYTFVATVDATPSTTWKLEGETVDLDNYGITLTGTAADGDKVTVVYTPAAAANPVGIILHDVDVTAGTKNAQVTVFGFVDVRMLDASVISALGSAKPDMITLVS